MKKIYVVMEGDSFTSEIDSSRAETHEMLAAFTSKEDAINYLPMALNRKVNKLANGKEGSSDCQWRVTPYDGYEHPEVYKSAISYEDDYYDGMYFYFVDELILDPEN